MADKTQLENNDVSAKKQDLSPEESKPKKSVQISKTNPKGKNAGSPSRKGAMRVVIMAGKLQAAKKASRRRNAYADFENLLQAQMRMKLSDSEGVSIVKKNLIHRVSCISLLRHEDRDEQQIINHYDKLFKHLQTLYQSESITGLLLIYKKHLVHVIETSSDMILKFVQDLASIEKDENGFASKSKILLVSHDIPDRLYTQWSPRVMDIEVHNLDQFDTSEEAYRVVGDILSQLLKLGVYLSKQPKLNLKSAMDSLHEKVPELLPQQGVVQYLLMENDDCMILPQEFVDMYESPFDVALASDETWPVSTRLFPY